MPTIDLKKFHAAIREDAAWQGRRCGDTRESDNPDIESAAITMSMLVKLRQYASHKMLGPKDIQQALDAFLEHSRMVEVEQPLGGTVFRRLGDMPETPKVSIYHKGKTRFHVVGGQAGQFVDIDTSHPFASVSELLLGVCCTGAQLRKVTSIILSGEPAERAKELDIEFTEQE